MECRFIKRTLAETNVSEDIKLIIPGGLNRVKQKWMYLEQKPSPEDFHIDGITVLDDYDSFSD